MDERPFYSRGVIEVGKEARTGIVALITVCLHVFGCAKCPKSGADFIGKYEMIRSDGKVYINVLSDGTFVERFERADGRDGLFRKGTWEFRANKERIRLLDYMSLSRRFSDRDLANIVEKKFDAWFLYHCKWGRIDIYLDEEQELFHKV